jgi:MFS family permease
MPARFWWVVAFAVVLTLARFSEAFLLLRAETMGLAVTWVPMILIVMNVVYAVSAYPFGKLSDNGSRRRLLTWGIVFLIAADLVLAIAGSIWMVGLGAAIWGLHMGATQGLLSALVSDAAPADLRGTAFGVFNLAIGVALLAASVIAGGLWTVVGPAMTFYAGAAFSAVALLGLLARRGERGRP